MFMRFALFSLIGLLAIIIFTQGTNSGQNTMFFVAGALLVGWALGYMFHNPYQSASYLVETTGPNNAQTPDKPIKQAKRANDYLYLEALPNPCLVIRAEDRIAFANSAAKALFSIPNSLGVSVAVLRDPDLQAAIAHIQKGVDAQTFEMEFSGKPDQNWRATIIPMGKQTVLVTFQDSTEIINAQKARADFLANASHELRTPLTAISGFIETLRGNKNPNPEQQKRFLSIIQRQTARMQSLIEDLLSLSEIETNEFIRPTDRINLWTTVKDAAQSFKTINMATPAMQVNIPENTPIWVHGDPGELAQIIENFLTNAAKYAPNSELNITMGVAESRAEARTACLTKWHEGMRTNLTETPLNSGRFAWVRVEDSGDGIPFSHLPRLGERFYRVDASRSNRVQGTGLGLAIVKHILNRHRGGLGVESLPGTGAAFGFWLPEA